MFEWVKRINISFWMGRSMFFEHCSRFKSIYQSFGQLFKNYFFLDFFVFSLFIFFTLSLYLIYKDCFLMLKITKLRTSKDQSRLFQLNMFCLFYRKTFTDQFKLVIIVIFSENNVLSIFHFVQLPYKFEIDPRKIFIIDHFM